MIFYLFWISRRVLEHVLNCFDYHAGLRFEQHFENYQLIERVNYLWKICLRLFCCTNDANADRRAWVEFELHYDATTGRATSVATVALSFLLPRCVRIRYHYCFPGIQKYFSAQDKSSATRYTGADIKCTACSMKGDDLPFPGGWRQTLAMAARRAFRRGPQNASAPSVLP